MGTKSGFDWYFLPPPLLAHYLLPPTHTHTEKEKHEDLKLFLLQSVPQEKEVLGLKIYFLCFS